MGNIIQTETPAKRREKILGLIASLMSKCDGSDDNNDDFNDQIAFICLSLTEIEKTIQQTVNPWEKRDYWVKADQFRSEWAWVGALRRSLAGKLKEDGWDDVEEEIGGLSQRLSGIEPSKKIGNQRFWQGAFKSVQGKR